MKKILNSPVDSRLAFAIYLAVLVFGTIIFSLASCKSEEQLAAQRAAKDEQTRQAEMALIEKTRQRLPCDTPRTTMQTVTEYLPGDTTYINNVAYVHDTTRQTVYKTRYIIDSAWLQQYRDSLASERYAFDLARQDANEQAKRADKAEAQAGPLKDDKAYWQRSAIATWVAISLGIGAWGAIKIFK